MYTGKAGILLLYWFMAFKLFFCGQLLYAACTQLRLLLRTAAQLLGREIEEEKRSKVQLSTFEGGLFVPHVNFHHD